MDKLDLMRPSPDADARLCKITPARREAERKELEAQIAAFKKSGKKITHLESGLRSTDPKPYREKKAA